jgi:GDP-L-fucose synthase
LESSHVIPAFVRKFIDAQEKGEASVTVWGTGSASREFLFVEDAVEGIVASTEKYDKADPVNLGTGKEITIKGLVDLVAQLIGLKGKIIWDNSKPDGHPRSCLDVSRAKYEFNFEAETELSVGLEKTIDW